MKRDGVPRPASPVRHDGLDDAGLRVLANADTAFVATRAPEGADVSHRGGPPGFLTAHDGTISWPDFQGNALFNDVTRLFG